MERLIAYLLDPTPDDKSLSDGRLANSTYSHHNDLDRGHFLNSNSFAECCGGYQRYNNTLHSAKDSSCVARVAELHVFAVPDSSSVSPKISK